MVPDSLCRRANEGRAGVSSCHTHDVCIMMWHARTGLDMPYIPGVQNLIRGQKQSLPPPPALRPNADSERSVGCPSA